MRRPSLFVSCCVLCVVCSRWLQLFGVLLLLLIVACCRCCCLLLVVCCVVSDGLRCGRWLVFVSVAGCWCLLCVIRWFRCMLCVAVWCCVLHCRGCCSLFEVCWLVVIVRCCLLMVVCCMLSFSCLVVCSWRSSAGVAVCGCGLLRRWHCLLAQRVVVGCVFACGCCVVMRALVLGGVLQLLLVVS